ncbi:hypothetical protein KHA93_16425 [Bacillus sp. FJAT-49732]|uniref:Uncharacterized protein n=1 Tax=Lederbergia citrisecunda TaxID=2833583 RepID=A0A942TN05_9BACI|nr:hypothetical protein [Lederbergia citrisecunda]MBS4201225.1 hypothetical protein [Lederbergia citrisecunda]
MKKSSSNEVKRGQAISFRVPSDTPDYLLKHLQRLKETERRNFSSKIAEFVMQGVGQSFSKKREIISVPLPHKLSKSQRNWLKHEHSEALLGSIIYQLLNDPVRTASLLASLNSNSLNLDEALYLQEEVEMEEQPIEVSNEEGHLHSFEETASTDDVDDIHTFKWESAKQNHSVRAEEENDAAENDLDSLLGDFLAAMNK